MPYTYRLKSVEYCPCGLGIATHEVVDPDGDVVVGRCLLCVRTLVDHYNREAREAAASHGDRTLPEEA